GLTVAHGESDRVLLQNVRGCGTWTSGRWPRSSVQKSSYCVHTERSRALQPIEQSAFMLRKAAHAIETQGRRGVTMTLRYGRLPSYLMTRLNLTTALLDSK